MRLLILTAWYAPFIHPRAHRWTALAEHWAAQGHEVHVVCGRIWGCVRQERKHEVWVHRTGFDSLKEWVYHKWGYQTGRGRVGIEVQAPSRSSRLLASLYRRVWKNICFPDDAVLWYLPTLRMARYLQQERSFDALITVSLPFTSHWVGKCLKREFPALRWLADVGDPFSFSPVPLNNDWLFGPLNRHIERHALLAADQVVVTDAAVLRKYHQLMGEEVAARISVIPPLLSDKTSIAHLHPVLAQHTILRLGFFGAMYAPVRTPDVLLNLVEQTLRLHPHKQIELHFYGEIFPEFYERLSTRPWVHLHGLRSREEVRAAMQGMDVLVNIGNRSDFQLPSKAIDYLAAGKPILNVSYTEPDPFADFLSRHLPDKSLLFNLKVREDKVEEGEVLRWVSWLGAGKPVSDRELLEARLAQFRADAVGASYLRCLGAG